VVDDLLHGVPVTLGDILPVVAPVSAAIAAAAGLVWRAQRDDVRALLAKLDSADAKRDAYHTGEVDRLRADAVATAATLQHVTAALTAATEVLRRVEDRLDASDASGRFVEPDAPKRRSR
jgi:hypothetical protein